MHMSHYTHAMRTHTPHSPHATHDATPLERPPQGTHSHKKKSAQVCVLAQNFSRPLTRFCYVTRGTFLYLYEMGS